ncbi:myogenesis-regulating glycosidase-like [Glandiceps talaboti]
MSATKGSSLGNLSKVILAIIVIFTLSLITWYQIPCSSGKIAQRGQISNINSEDGGIQTLIVGNLILDATTGQFVIKNRSHSERLRVTYGLGIDFTQGFTECEMKGSNLDDIVDNACMEVENKMKFVVTHTSFESMDCYDIKWISLSCDVIPMDCLHMANAHWFGGAETLYQYWPIESSHLAMKPYVTTRHGSVLERYWVNCRGVGIKMDDFVPLHVSVNNDDAMLCFKSSYDSKVYSNLDGEHLQLKYQVCLGNNVKMTHQFMSQRHFDRPSAVPAEEMFRKPIWSTWVRHGKHVDQGKVMQFADEINSHWFPNGQLEIDDNWSTVYGDFEFNHAKFPNPRDMVDRLHGMGFTVSVWVTPFANLDSKAFTEGLNNGYWVEDGKGQTPAVVKWFSPNIGTILDVTNPEAVEWFLSRLERLRHDVGIDAFKCDAGEVYYLPQSYITQHPLRSPNEYSTKYVEMVSRLGDKTEVRTAHRTQVFPVFVRIFDRFTRWGYDNGLKSIIPTMFVFGLHGYPFILPDMIAGNDMARQIDTDPELPDRELYIRWVQLNAYLPVMQFSVVPWEYNSEVLEITRKMVDIHEQIVVPIVLKAALEAVQTGAPIIRPLWWISPDESSALQCDDEFLVGDQLLVAPILDKGARERDIYLPAGEWTDNLHGGYLEGSQWIKGYHVELQEIATFTSKVK